MATLTTDAARSSDWAFKQLFKLESKCRAPTPATQVEAIGAFPKLLDQFPFPTLVSSAFLKLGDLFRSSPNSLRYHIAQVFEASQQHLAQISQTEELLKRILVVLYSNDSIARVLALRLLGNASSVFAKYPEAQHGILLRYQSSHPLEIVAAAQTTESMLKYSPGFLEVVWKTVLAKANDEKVPDSVRVQLIRSLQHAAPNLTLSTLLYSHCQRWVRQPENTAIVLCAAMCTWKAVVQRHNELQLDDADYVSQYTTHELTSIRRAALALLGKWRPLYQTANTGRMAEIKRRFTAQLHRLLADVATSVDLYELRQATVVLARIEAADKGAGTPESWSVVHAYAAWARRAFYDSSNSPQSPAKTNRQLHASNSLEVDLAYRYLVSSAMLAINVATILDSADCKTAAAGIVRGAWEILSEVGGGGSGDGVIRYLRRFLRMSWFWCRSMDVESEIVPSVSTMIGSHCRPIACKAIAIGSCLQYFDYVAAACRERIEEFASALDSNGLGSFDSSAAWHAISLLLTFRQRNPQSPASDIAVNAITRWSEHICSLAVQPSVHTSVFAETGPPAWMIQKLMALLAANGYWNALYSFCRSLPTHGLSSNVQGWLSAIASVAQAEGCVDDATSFLGHIDLSLMTTRSLDYQGPPCRYRLFLIQLRRELVCLHYEWRQLQLAAIAPAACFMARSLICRTRSLASQADLLACTLSTIDASTFAWLSQVQLGLRRTLHAVNSVMPTAEQGQLDAQAMAAAALAAINQPAATFTPGSALFIEPLRPVISVETRPDLEGSDSPFAVFSGAEFNFAVEGFLQLPRHPLPATPQRIRIAIWLARQPRRSAGQDLQLCAKYFDIAQQTAGPSTSRQAPESADNSGLESLLDKATVFEADLDGDYFTCSCALAVPSLRAMFGHADANAILYIHILCTLVDSSDCNWWTGSHMSYPLFISTTAKA